MRVARLSGHLVVEVTRQGRTPIHEFVCDDGYTLGRWIATQRSRWREGRISQERTDRLEALPEWTWHGMPGPADPISLRHRGRWQASYDKLAAWAVIHGRACPVQDVRVGNFAMGRWVNKQRMAYKANRMPQDRIDSLEALPDWQWQLRGPPSAGIEPGDH